MLKQWLRPDLWASHNITWFFWSFSNFNFSCSLLPDSSLIGFSALIILTLRVSAVCTFWPCDILLICTDICISVYWYQFPYFLSSQYVVLAIAWYPFAQVGQNRLWLVSATPAELVLTNLFSVVQPLVNRFCPLAVRFSFSLCLAGIHLALGALLCRSFVVLLLLNCKVNSLFSLMDPFLTGNKNTVFL